MQLGDGLIHVEESTLFGYFADDLQQKGGKKCGSEVPGCSEATFSVSFLLLQQPCQPFTSIQPHKALYSTKH